MEEEHTTECSMERQFALYGQPIDQAQVLSEEVAGKNRLDDHSCVPINAINKEYLQSLSEKLTSQTEGRV